jgi:hypothetical protein
VIKESSHIPFICIHDTLGADRLTPNVMGTKQTADGHLLELATESSMLLATLDKGIPWAFVIP